MQRGGYEKHAFEAIPGAQATYISIEPSPPTTINVSIGSAYSENLEVIANREPSHAFDEYLPEAVDRIRNE